MTNVFKKITIVNNTKESLKVLVISDSNKFQKQKVRQTVSHKKRMTFELPNDFTRMILSRD